jgi:hypothetical protein
MSGHHARVGLQSRHPAHPAIAAAAAAIILLAVAACSSTAATRTSATAAAVASVGPGGHAPTLTGAGSTFDEPFFSAAFARYQQQHPAVTIGYSAVGSSAGITAISARQVNFGASDVPMTAGEQAATQGGSITQVPVDLGGARPDPAARPHHAPADHRPRRHQPPELTRSGDQRQLDADRGHYLTGALRPRGLL